MPDLKLHQETTSSGDKCCDNVCRKDHNCDRKKNGTSDFEGTLIRVQEYTLGRTLKQHPQRDFNNFRGKTPASKHLPQFTECIRSGGHW
jgi:hypothetical protein